MGKFSKDSPSPPPPVVVNPGATAQQQAQYNRDAALEQRALNMVDQRTPRGNVTYEATGGERVEGIPDYRVTQTLSPAQQELTDLSDALSKKYGEIGNTQLDAVRSSLETPFSTGSLGAAPAINQGVRDQALERILARAQPQLDRDRAALETSLANRGFTAGTEAYDTEYDQFNRGITDFRLAADASAGNEMSRLFGLEASARDRAINELMMQRQQPLSELSAFASGAQPTAPSFVGTPQGQVAAPDYGGMAYGSANQQNAAAQNAFNAATGNYQQNLAGLYGMGSAGLQAAGWKWSDRRLKRDIEKVGELENGLGVYRYRYAWDDQVELGVMADEVREIQPEAVMQIAGFDAVDYDQVGR